MPITGPGANTSGVVKVKRDSIYKTSASEAQAANDSSCSEQNNLEKMFLLGVDKLDDAELLALVIGGAHPLQYAKVVMSEVGLHKLSRACPHELRELTGVGASGAAALVAATELGRRVAHLDAGWAQVIERPQDAETFLRSMLHGLDQERFVVIGLDARQRVRMIRTVAAGTLNRVDVHPRDVFRPLIRASMHSCLIAHNHPSGDATPSESDITLTEKMVCAGRIIGIPVVDHLIVSDNGFVSIAELGLIPDTLEKSS